MYHLLTRRSTPIPQPSLFTKLNNLLLSLLSQDSTLLLSSISLGIHPLEKQLFTQNLKSKGIQAVTHKIE